MQRDVITKVRDELQSHKDQYFSMATLGAKSRDPFDYSIIDQTYDEADKSCGTVMCLAGYTCAIFAPGTVIGRALEKQPN